MNLTKKGKRNTHRGVIGIESAIVMIAFVIVAAALSFVVLNMGFSTTQKAKAAITSGLEEVAGSLQLSGVQIGIGHVSTGKLNATAVPITVAGDAGSVNLDPSVTTVTYVGPGIQYSNIYGAGCMLNSTTYSDISSAMTAAITKGCINANPVTTGGNTLTKAVIYFTTQKNTNSIVEPGEVANVVVVYKTADRPTSPSFTKTEILPPTGSILTIEKNVPPVLDKYVDMG